MEPTESAIDAGIAVPLGKMRARIEHLATILVNVEATKGADVAARQRNKAAEDTVKCPFLSPEHPYFPFFEMRLREFKENPSLMPKIKTRAEVEAENAANSSAAAAATSSTAQEEAAERERRVREEQLALAEQQAKRDRTDPHPSVYGLHIPAGVSVSKPVYDVMMVTAQCGAKGGEAFLKRVAKEKEGNRLFSFLSENDPAHPTFLSLLYAYVHILHYKAEATQDRLEAYEKGGARLEEVLSAKAAFLTAEAARAKAAVLTDDELRKRLEWNTFTVKKSFSALELGLVTKESVAEAEAAAAAGAPAAVPSGAIGWGDEGDNAAPAAAPSAPSREVVGVAKRSGNSEYVRDPITGELVHISLVTKKGNGSNGAGSSLFGTDGSAASGIVESGQKRGRDDGLASDEAYDAYLRKM